MENTSAPVTGPDANPQVSPEVQLSLKPDSNPLKGILLGAVLLIVVLIAAGSYLFMQNQKLAQRTPELSPAPSAIASAADPTAGWKTFSYSKFGIEIKYPGDWFDKTCSAEFGLMLDKEEQPVCETEPTYDIIVTTLTSITQLNQFEAAWSGGYKFTRETSVNNFSVYLIEKTEPAPGPDKMKIFALPVKDGIFEIILNDLSQEQIARQMLGTFSFASGDSVTGTGSIKLAYSLPAGWETAKNVETGFQVGYDPAKYAATVDKSLITFSYRAAPGSFSFMKTPYDGGSRHTFIYKQQGYTSAPVSERMDGYHEQEYSYNGWSCLVLYRLSYSAAGTTWGMCPVSGSQAIYFGGPENQKEMESILSTLKTL